MVLRKDIAIIVVLLAFSLLTTGCGTARKITGEITSDVLGRRAPLKKKIAFLPALSSSSFGGDDLSEAATRELEAHVRRHCDDLDVVDSQKIRQALKKISRFPSGDVDNFALANSGRIYGLNALVQESIVDAELVTDKRGIWGFRRTARLLQATVRLRVLDVETTAVLLDEVVEDAVEISDEEWQNIKKNNIYNTELAHTLMAKITPEAAEMICDRLAEEPWKGYITASGENGFTISAGSDAGLAPEDVLEVFGMGEPIQGQRNHVYLVSGPKIGEIKITRADENQAEAVGLFGKDLEKSCCVMLKP
jgi:hypothetical protein